jgi:hypothetical protein
MVLQRRNRSVEEVFLFSSARKAVDPSVITQSCDLRKQSKKTNDAMLGRKVKKKTQF